MTCNQVTLELPVGSQVRSEKGKSNNIESSQIVEMEILSFVYSSYLEYSNTDFSLPFLMMIPPNVQRNHVYDKADSEGFH